MKPQRSCCVCQQSSSPSIHAAICSATSSMVHPTSCSTARPAPRHLQKSAIPKGFLNSKAAFQLHIKGEASVFKPSAPEFTEPGSRETKRPSFCLHLPCPGLLTANTGNFPGFGFLPQPPLQSLGPAGFGGLPRHPPATLDHPVEVG